LSNFDTRYLRKSIGWSKIAGPRSTKPVATHTDSKGTVNWKNTKPVKIEIPPFLIEPELLSFKRPDKKK